MSLTTSLPSKMLSFWSTMAEGARFDPGALYLLYVFTIGLLVTTNAITIRVFRRREQQRIDSILAQAVEVGTAALGQELRAEVILQCTEHLERKQKQLRQLQQHVAHIQQHVARMEKEASALQRCQAFWKAEQEVFEPGLLEKLKKEGAGAWHEMTLHGAKWKKESVLAVFFSGNLPYEMEEKNWNKFAPESICDDRDVLLARVGRTEFPNHYAFYFGDTMFRIPKALLGDKEVVTAVVHRYPEVLLQNDLPTEMLDDVAVFYAYWNSERRMYLLYPDGIDLYDSTKRERFEKLLARFGTEIRGSAELMLKAAKQMRSPVVFEYFAESLSDDSSFALELAKLTNQVPKNALERFSDRVKANRDIVLVLVQKNGLCLKDADEALKSDVEVVRAACKENVAAMVHCAPRPIQQSLLRDKDFMLNIFSRWPCCDPLSHHGCEVYNMLSEDLKLDHDIVIHAYLRGCLAVSEFPTELTRDREFWMKLIEQDSSVWSELPEKYAGEAMFARNIRCFETEELFEDVTSRFPFLFKERALWSTVIESECEIEEIFMDLLREHLPERFLRDKELMLSACRCNPEVLQLLPVELQQDRDLVEAAIEPNSQYMPPEPKPDALKYIPKSVQVLYPNLTAKAISNVIKGDGSVYYGDVTDSHMALVAESLWENLKIWEAWFEIGGELHSRLPESMKENREFGLLVAKHQQGFETATSVALRSDKAYMMKAVETDCTLFIAAHGRLRRDFDLAVLACSDVNYPELVECIEWAGELDQNAADRIDEDWDFLRSVRAKAKAKVQAHAGFTEAFVYGMTDFAGPGCHLPMLVHDKETCSGLKRLIADFLDVPTGKEVSKLRRVVENVKGVPL